MARPKTGKKPRTKSKPVKKISFFYRYALFFILILAFLLRLYHFDNRPLWYDEFFTQNVVNGSWEIMMQKIIADTHPPMYYIALKPWAAIFNYSTFGLRSFSLIWGLLGIWGLYLFCREAAGKRTAILATLLATLSPFALQYSQEARMYAMSGGLIIFAAFFLLKGISDDKWQYHFTWGLFLSTAILTHYFSLFFIPLFLLMALILSRRKKLQIQSTKKRKEKPWLLLLLGFGITLESFLSWLGYFIVQIQSHRDGLRWIEPAHFSDMFKTLEIFITGSPFGQMGVPQPNNLHIISPETALTLTIIFISTLIIYLYTKRDKNFWLFSIPAFGVIIFTYILSLLGQHFFISRYFFPSAYFFYALMALWLNLVLPTSSRSQT